MSSDRGDASSLRDEPSPDLELQVKLVQFSRVKRKENRDGISSGLN